MGKPLQTLVAILILCTSVQANDPLDIRVVGTNWGDVSIRDIQAVLTSSANTLWKYAEPEALHPILVMRSKEGPIVLFKRGPRGEYFVKLNTGERYWCQYAFQIAHEIGHILCRYKDGDANNKWFEETLCETASLFALRAMSESWKTDPPYQNWKIYAPNLNKYAEERIQRYGLPEGKHLATFYAEQAPQLRAEATDRSKNAAIAIELLPLFEKNPEGWRAVHYINESVWNETQDFTTYLRNWYRHTPKDLKPFVAKVAEKFGIRAKVQNNKASVTVSES